VSQGPARVSSSNSMKPTTVAPWRRWFPLLFAIAFCPLIALAMPVGLRTWFILPSIFAVFFLPGIALVGLVRDILDLTVLDTVVLGFALSLVIDLMILLILSSIGLSLQLTTWLIFLSTVLFLLVSRKERAPEPPNGDREAERLCNHSTATALKMNPMRVGDLRIARLVNPISLLLLGILIVYPVVANDSSLSGLDVGILLIGFGLFLVRTLVTMRWRQNWVSVVLFVIASLLLVLANLFPPIQALPRLVRLGLLGAGVFFLFVIWYSTIRGSAEPRGVCRSPGEPLSSTLLWGIMAAAALLSFLVPYLGAPSAVIGWDTPSYIWRAEYMNVHGFWRVATLAQDTGMMHPAVSVILHRTAHLDFASTEKVVRAMVGAMTCGAFGYLAYRATRSRFLLIASFGLAVGWYTPVRMVQDFGNNLLALLFTVLTLAVFQEQDLVPSRASTAREILGGVLWFTACLAHILFSPIFFLAIILFRSMQCIDFSKTHADYGLFRISWRGLRAPMIGQAAAIAFWFGVLGGALPDPLGGAQQVLTAADVVSKGQDYLAALFAHSGLYSNALWMIVGAGAAWFLVYRSDRLARALLPLVLVTVTLFALFPGGPAWRIYLLIPLPLLGTMAVSWFLQGPEQSRLDLPRYILVSVAATVLTWINIHSAIGYLVTRPSWMATESNLPTLVQLRDYLAEKGPSGEHLYLAYDESDDAFAMASLWHNILRAVMFETDAREVNVYFGTIDSVLCNQPIDTGNPLVDGTYRLWNEMLERGEIFEEYETVFIVSSFNPSDQFEAYLQLPFVEPLLPGVLMVKLDAVECNNGQVREVE
jgi:hypothetical protein